MPHHATYVPHGVIPAVLLPFLGPSSLDLSRVWMRQEPDWSIFVQLRISRTLLGLFAGGACYGFYAYYTSTKTTDKKVGEVLASLARLGYVTTEDGKTFILRRAA